MATPADNIRFSGKNPLETGGEDVKLHSKRVENSGPHVHGEWASCSVSPCTGEVQLQAGQVDQVSHSIGAVRAQNIVLNICFMNSC